MCSIYQSVDVKWRVTFDEALTMVRRGARVKFLQIVQIEAGIVSISVKLLRINSTQFKQYSLNTHIIYGRVERLNELIIDENVLTLEWTVVDLAPWLRRKFLFISSAAI